jgi:hypothetical protein
VYETKFDRRPSLLRRIFAAAEHIKNHPETTAEATQSLLMRAENPKEDTLNSYRDFFCAYLMVWLLINVKQHTFFKTSLVIVSVTVKTRTGVCLIISTQIHPRNISYKFGWNLTAHSVYIVGSWNLTFEICLAL